MSFYRALGRYEYNEQEITDIKTGERFTACERNKLFSEDYYLVYRFNYATPIGDGRTKDHLFEFLLMPDGYSLEIVVCDYEQGKKVIEKNLDGLLKGRADPRELLKDLEKVKGEEQV